MRMKWINLQDSAQTKSQDSYQRFTESAWESARHCTLRGQLDFNYASEPLDIDQVEDAKHIVKRFATGHRCYIALLYWHCIFWKYYVCLFIPKMTSQFI